MKNRFLRCVLCFLLIGCLFISQSPVQVRAMDPFTMGVLSSPEVIPIILGWLGITANPAAPEAFNQVSNGLSEHLKNEGYIVDNSIKAAFYMAGGTAADKTKAIPYLQKALLASSLNWLYTGKVGEAAIPVLGSATDNGSQPNSDGLYEYSYSYWMSSGTLVFNAPFALYRVIVGEKPNQQAKMCILTASEYRYMDTRAWPGEKVSEGVYLHIVGNYGINDNVTFNVPFIDVPSIDALKSQSFCPANVAVSTNKVVPKGGDVAAGILDPAITVIKSIPRGMFDPDVPDKDKKIPIVPINPGWTSGMGQAEAQTPGEMQLPVFPISLSVVQKYGDTIIDTDLKYSCTPGEPLDLTALNNILSMKEFAYPENFDHWETEEGVAVDAATVPLNTWTKIVGIMVGPAPEVKPELPDVPSGSETITQSGLTSVLGDWLSSLLKGLTSLATGTWLTTALDALSKLVTGSWLDTYLGALGKLLTGSWLGELIKALKGLLTGEWIEALKKLLGANTLSELLSKVVADIIAGVKALVIPRADYITMKVDALCANFEFANAIVLTGKNIFNGLSGISGGPPQIWIDLGASRNGHNYGGRMLFLDLSWYAEYKPTVDAILSGFIWACFAWKYFKKLPGIINGTSDDVTFISDLSRSEK